MSKVLCVLYDDPVDGYPRAYARDAVPVIATYPDGQTTPNPDEIDFTPGELLGSVSGELVEVSSGLEADDVVVTRGAFVLRDGDRVHVVAGAEEGA